MKAVTRDSGTQVAPNAKDAKSRHHGHRLAMVALFGISLTVRAAVGLHSYSGEKTPPMFGDYEAQRHWMELAVNVPAREWYRNTPNNDLSYWGLDYPPLSGFVSWLAGHFLMLVDPAAVALHTSRGFETASTRAAMRTTVLLGDAVVFFPALALFSRSTGMRFSIKPLAFCATLPALIVIDHGHFQYNSISLGLFISSVAAYLSDQDTLGAVLFCLSVYFKQMSLYYALAIFVMHLTRLINITYSRSVISGAVYATRVLTAIVAVTVLSFWPWLSNLAHVLHRLFPVSRGLYQDKVANVWCSISVIIKLNRLLPRDRLVQLCTIVTFVASLPFCAAAARKRTTQTVLLSLTGCALSAYLFAFQVHEKQILLPLIPLALLFDTHPALCMWMSLAASTSLFPLLARERLILPYVVLTLMQALVVREIWPSSGRRQILPNGCPTLQRIGELPRRIAIPTFFIGAALHIALLALTPPESIPDLYVMLLIIFSCAIFCGVYVALLVALWVK